MTNEQRIQIGKRIEAARVARGWSQAQLAVAAGTSQSTVDRIEKGAGKRNSGAIITVMRALGLPIDTPPLTPASLPEWQAMKRAPEKELFSSAERMPVYALAEGGEGVALIDREAFEYVDRPYILKDVAAAYAILIDGDSMFPAFEPGDKAWVNPKLPPQRDYNCIFYSVNDALGEEKASVKRLIGISPTHWTVEQWNPPKKFKLDRKEWQVCHRVVGKFAR